MKAYIAGSRDDRIVNAIKKNLRNVERGLEEHITRPISADETEETDRVETIEVLTDAEGQLVAALSRIRFLLEQESKGGVA